MNTESFVFNILLPAAVALPLYLAVRLAVKACKAFHDEEQEDLRRLHRRSMEDRQR